MQIVETMFLYIVIKIVLNGLFCVDDVFNVQSFNTHLKESSNGNQKYFFISTTTAR